MQRRGEVDPQRDELPPLLPTELQEEKSQLLEEGFATWRRADLTAFLSALVKHGRDNLAAIAAEVPGKSEAEVLAYAKTFFEKAPSCVPEWPRALRRLERTEARLADQRRMERAVAVKARARRPLRARACPRPQSLTHAGPVAPTRCRDAPTLGSSSRWRTLPTPTSTSRQRRIVCSSAWCTSMAMARGGSSSALCDAVRWCNTTTSCWLGPAGSWHDGARC